MPRKLPPHSTSHVRRRMRVCKKPLWILHDPRNMEPISLVFARSRVRNIDKEGALQATE